MESLQRCIDIASATNAQVAATNDMLDHSRSFHYNHAMPYLTHSQSKKYAPERTLQQTINSLAERQSTVGQKKLNLLFNGVHQLLKMHKADIIELKLQKDELKSELQREVDSQVEHSKLDCQTRLSEKDILHSDLKNKIESLKRSEEENSQRCKQLNNNVSAKKKREDRLRNEEERMLLEIQSLSKTLNKLNGERESVTKEISLYETECSMDNTVSENERIKQESLSKKISTLKAQRKEQRQSSSDLNKENKKMIEWELARVKKLLDEKTKEADEKELNFNTSKKLFQCVTQQFLKADESENILKVTDRVDDLSQLENLPAHERDEFANWLIALAK